MPPQIVPDGFRGNAQRGGGGIRRRAPIWRHRTSGKGRRIVVTIIPVIPLGPLKPPAWERRTTGLAYLQTALKSPAHLARRTFRDVQNSEGFEDLLDLEDGAAIQSP